MTWKFYQPFELSTPVTAEVDSGPITSFAFDGHSIWVPFEMGIKKISFWGPYVDAEMESQFNRKTEPEVDSITIGSIGPKLVIEKSIDLPITPRSIEYGDGYIYAVDYPISTLVVINATTGKHVNTVNFPINEYRRSQIKLVGKRLYYIGSRPTSQNNVDAQSLFHFDVSNPLSIPAITAATATLQDRKQEECRYLAAANGYLYVSSHNSFGVHKYDALTGAYIKSIQINKDITHLLTVDNEVMCVSKGSVPEVEGAAFIKKIGSDGKITFPGEDPEKPVEVKLPTALSSSQWQQMLADGTHMYMCEPGKKNISKYKISDGTLEQTIGTPGPVVGIAISGGSLVYLEPKTYDPSSVAVDFGSQPTELISKINLDDSVSHLYGVIGTKVESYADDGVNIWSVNSDGNIQRTRKSDKKTFLTGEDNDYEIDDEEYAKNLKGVFVTPQFEYQYWDGNSFQNCTVPKHLFLIKDGKVVGFRLPNVFVWEYEQTINQNTAISTGGYEYKG